MSRLIIGSAVGAIAFLLAVPASAGVTIQRKQNGDYVREWCRRNGGQADFPVSLRSRVTCLTRRHAVEIDNAYKWKSAIDVALRYGRESGLRPKLVLVIENPLERKYLEDTRKYVKKEKLQLDVEAFENLTPIKRSFAQNESSGQKRR